MAEKDDVSNGHLSKPEPRQVLSMKSLPVAFILLVFGIMWGVFMHIHIRWLLQWDKEPDRRDFSREARGQIEGIIFVLIAIMWIACYAQCIVTPPGGIPDTDEWKYKEGDSNSEVGEDVQHEKKKGGKRRWCKWCHRYKPDRCHHCRVCKVCVLKMDHHCPWIHNCVGFGNHKYFFLLLLYSVSACHLVSWGMVESVQLSIDVETPFWTMLALLFGESLAVFLAMLLSAFWGFHIWLVLQAMTTIEFCEKSSKNGNGNGNYISPYRRPTALGNIQDVLGKNPIVWLLPVRGPPAPATSGARGPGLTYLDERTALVQDGSGSSGGGGNYKR
mmetsp:Transcript_22871/g.58538  ORF Transcript_22871/g.58538 Transcript_22871/m.58538 type:complete len:330 (+) Transcript_22871:79-1068(+)